jgi:hypothetical protein
MGYILNPLAASQVLQYDNSTADVVLKVWMTAHINDTRLPVQQEEWPLKSGIKLAYLPKVLVDNFGTATMEKFRMLEMVEYDRATSFVLSVILTIIWRRPMMVHLNHMWVFKEGLLQLMEETSL